MFCLYNVLFTSNILVLCSNHNAGFVFSTLVTPRLRTSTMPEDSTQINVVAARLPDFSSQEALTWFRRVETKFRIRGITQPTTKADYVLEALPEEIFRRIGPWLDQQSDEIPYQDLKKHLLKEFSPTTSERARRLLRMPSQPIGDRKPSQLWNEICTLSRLPEVDEVTKQHKEVDLKKEFGCRVYLVAIESSSTTQTTQLWMSGLHWPMTSPRHRMQFAVQPYQLQQLDNSNTATQQLDNTI